jgi:hypothetical protein
MSRSTFGFTPELDKVWSVCRLLNAFLTAYSRLPGGPSRRTASWLSRRHKRSISALRPPRNRRFANRDLTPVLDVGPTRLEREDVRLSESQLGRVFHRHQPLSSVMNPASTPRSVVLPMPAPRDDEIRSTAHTHCEEPQSAGRCSRNAAGVGRRDRYDENFRIVSAGPRSERGE